LGEVLRRYQAECEIKENRITLTKCYVPSFCKRLIERSYLDPKSKALDPLEAALWASREQISINGKTGWDVAIDVISILRIPLKLLIAYVALRRRYPNVYRWVRKDTLLAYGEGGGKKIEVLVLEEGEEVLVEDIIQWSIAASKDDHDPVIAIVDRNGSITFYEAKAVTTLA
jgi:tRNA-intron endonuclease